MRESEPLFVISVASRLLQLHPQTLRKYEREGFVNPFRTPGNLRVYSSEDIERLRQVKYLVEERGVNLAGVQMLLGLTEQLRGLREQLGQVSQVDARDMTAVIDELLASIGATPDPNTERAPAATTRSATVEVRVQRKPRNA